MTYRFFVHDPDGDIEKVKTQQEAIDKANSLLEFYRENSADDGWDELAEQIFWGEIKQTAEMVNKEPAPEGSGFDYTCDYALTDVPPEQSSVPDGYHLVTDATLRRAIMSLIDRVTKTPLSCNEVAVEQLRFMNEIAEEPKLEAAALISYMNTITQNLKPQAGNYLHEQVVDMLVHRLNNRSQGRIDEQK